MAFRIIDKIYGRRNSIDKDVTNEYIELFKKAPEIREWSPSIWTVGSTGSGKTTFGMINNSLCLKYDTFLWELNYESHLIQPDGSPTQEDVEDYCLIKKNEKWFKPRTIAFWQFPEHVIEEIKKKMKKTGFEDYAPRIRAVKKLRELRVNDLYYVDEGVLSMDAKKALKKEMRAINEAITYHRHKRMPWIINSTDDGVLKGLRSKAQIRIYKRLTSGYVKGTDDSFAKQNFETISKLKKMESLITSEYHYLPDQFKGKLVLHMDDYCPWFDMEVSQNLSDFSFDPRYEEHQLIEEKVNHFAPLVLEYFGEEDLFKVKKINTIVKEWFNENYKDDFFDFEQHAQKIVNRALWLQYKKNKTGKAKKKEKIEEKIRNMMEFELDDVEAAKLSETLSPIEVEVYERWKNGEDQKSIALEYDKICEKFGILDQKPVTQAAISHKCRKVQGEVSRIKGFKYEDFLTLKLEERYKNQDVEVKHMGDEGEPDIVVCFNDKSRIDIFSVKLRGKSRSGEAQEIPIKKFNPEIIYARKQEKRGYYKKVNLIIHIFDDYKKIYDEGKINKNSWMTDKNLPQKIYITSNFELKI